MNEFIVHIKRHCGWHTTTAEGETFSEAAIAAVVATCKQFGLNVADIPHRAEFKPGDDGDRYYTVPTVVFYETSAREIFDPFLLGGWGLTKPGQPWFSERVREGEPDDCRACGGTGVDFYNPFRQCWKCGKRGVRVELEHLGGGRYQSIRESCGTGKESAR